MEQVAREQRVNITCKHRGQNCSQNNNYRSTHCKQGVRGLCVEVCLLNTKAQRAYFNNNKEFVRVRIGEEGEHGIDCITGTYMYLTTES